METRTIEINLNEARLWYRSEIRPLREIALRVFSEKELTYDFRNITTFEKACEALDLNDSDIVANKIAEYSKASAAAFKLNIVKKALNLNSDLSLTKGSKDHYIYFPHNPFATSKSTYYEEEVKLGKMAEIGKITCNGVLYSVFNGRIEQSISINLCYSNPENSVCFAPTDIGFLGCATREIAQHFGKYFGMLITEAKYGDMSDFKVIEDRYKNTK